MKFTGFIFFIFFSWSLSLQAKDLHLFFIHGLGDSQEAFCDMPEALVRYYQSQGHTLYIKNLEYSTLDDELTTRDFSEQITEHINQYFSEKELPRDTPYSFVVHSQGGLVATKYIINKIKGCYSDDPPASNILQQGCQAPANLQDVISLGSPFWGSQGANTSQIFWIDSLLKSASGMYKQLQHLRIGSVALGNSRSMMLSNIQSDGTWKHPVPGRHNIRFHNFAGIINPYLRDGLNAVDSIYDYFTGSSLQNLFIGDEKQEMDIVVSPSSARIDFNYVVQEGESKSLVRGKTRLGHSFYAAPMAHIPLEQYNSRFGGLTNAFMQVDALKGMACKEGLGLYGSSENRHLGFRFVISVLDNYFSEQQDQPVELPWYPHRQGLANFLVDMQIHMPLELQRRPRLRQEDISIEVKQEGRISDPILESGILFTGVGFNDDDNSQANKKYFSFHHDGRFNQNLSQNCCVLDPLANQEPPGADLIYKISTPGFETLEIEVPVNISYSSFVKFYLKPYRPIGKQVEPSRYISQHSGSFLQNDYIVSAQKIEGRYILGIVGNSASDQRQVFRMESFSAQELVNDLNPLGVRNLQFLTGPSFTQCYVGLTAPSVVSNQGEPGVRVSDKTQVFASLFALEADAEMRPGVKVKVLGRMSRPERSLELPAMDRYLISVPRSNSRLTADRQRFGDPMVSPPPRFNQIPFIQRGEERYIWVNVTDVDIVEDLACAESF